MLDKTVEELMFEIETLMQECVDVKELRLKLIDVAFDKSPYTDDSTFVINFGRLRKAFKARITCDSKEPCVKCNFYKDCEFITLMSLITELVVALTFITPEVREQWIQEQGHDSLLN